MDSVSNASGEASPVGPWDIALLLTFIGVIIYWILQQRKKVKSDVNSIVGLDGNDVVGNGHVIEDSGFLSKMKKSDKTIAIFYGSQTGTAEEFSQRLAKDAQKYDLKCGVFDPEEYEMDELLEMRDEIMNSLVIFVVATYGEGDPTDNTIPLYEWLKDGPDLTGLNFSVFALGNKTYEHYQGFGRYIDKRMEELGGVRLYERGEGDDDGNIEEDFMLWRERFWVAICDFYGVRQDTRKLSECISRDFELKKIKDIADDKVFKGELSKLGSYSNPRPPYDSKNPYMAPISVNREIFKGGDRSCMHIEIDISDCGVRYEAGDHVGIYPTNDIELVESIGELLNVNLDEVISLDCIDKESGKKHPFPCPCTYRTALSHYVDIASPVKTHVLIELLPYVTDKEELGKLQKITAPTDDGRNMYNEWIVKDHRHIVSILEDLPSCKPPLDLLLEFLPRLHCRYYSISSSAKYHKESIHVTAVVVDWTTRTGRRQKGVATTWLKTMSPADVIIPKVPIFVRHTTFRLPTKPHVPVLMVGPGTGLAPFRGFIQERAHQKESGLDVGDTILYYGCRKRKEDFIYEEELIDYEKRGVITHLYLAFSRDQDEKQYVTHKLKENSKDIWELVKAGGHLYVCGDAKSMAKDVNEIFLTAFKIHGGKTTEQATSFLRSLSNKGRYSVDVWS